MRRPYWTCPHRASYPSRRRRSPPGRRPDEASRRGRRGRALLASRYPLIRTKGRTMEASTTRPLGFARLVALALVALAIAGLGYLHFGTGATGVSVPADAHAGQLTLHACTYGTEAGGAKADCGTLVVP